MTRREFIALVGGAAAAWPLAARAQQPQSMRRIGVMMGLREDDRLGQQQAQALRTGLQELGWTDTRNIRIDFHWGLGEPGRAQSVAKELVALQPDLIVSHSVLVSIAVFRTTKTIPIVFVNVADPIGSGLVSGYSRPGGNITGFTNFEPTMGGKWVEVLKDLDSQVRRVAILFNPETAAGGGEYFLPSFRAACAALGLEPIEAPVHDGNEIKLAIDALAREPNGGLVAMADIYTGLNSELIIGSALNHRLPLIGGFRLWPESGGLISYGSSATDIFHNAASYVDRILKGASPADLPVQAPTKFELVINLKTARALGVTVSHDFLLRADDIIE